MTSRGAWLAALAFLAGLRLGVAERPPIAPAGPRRLNPVHL